MEIHEAPMRGRRAPVGASATGATIPSWLGNSFATSKASSLAASVPTAPRTTMCSDGTADAAVDAHADVDDEGPMRFRGACRSTSASNSSSSATDSLRATLTTVLAVLASFVSATSQGPLQLAVVGVGFDLDLPHSFLLLPLTLIRKIAQLCCRNSSSRRAFWYGHPFRWAAAPPAASEIAPPPRQGGRQPHNRLRRRRMGRRVSGSPGHWHEIGLGREAACKCARGEDEAGLVAAAASRPKWCNIFRHV